METDIFTKYLYFWGSLGGLGVFAYIYHLRQDLRRRMLRMGIAVGIAGVFSEGVFFRDYWHPPLVIRFDRFGGIEDFFFGIAFGGICVALYDVVFHKRLKRKGFPHYWIMSLLILSELICVKGLTPYINSIYASAIGFIIPAIIIIYLRRDLIAETLLSALLGGSILAFMEMIMLALAPSYLKQYYFLYGKVPLIFGIVPLTEFLWGAAFAAVVGPIRDFEFGYVPINMRSKSKARIKKYSSKRNKPVRRKLGLAAASARR